ncbi:TadE/TadG family type IV pilus assembly protein [Roseibium sp.]|uniref:TadE/TadG family type IV pilus assembly protein n=1 Tax=Roseibium sp. TaxID=1936156 RepID=UPI003BB01DA0
MRKSQCHFSTSLLKRLCRDKQGSILPIFGVMVIMMVVIAGAAFDVSRTVNAREKLSYALDAAALALAAELSTTFMSNAEIEEALADSFRANLSNTEFVDAAIENLEFTVDSDSGLVTVSSSATLNNYFLDFGGYMMEHIGPETFTFGTSAQVTYSRFDVEMAMVVDVTGSMSSNMGTLRDAAESVVNILIPSGTDADESKVKISLVPYSQGVNLGSYAATVTNGDATSNNCVNERQGDERLTDAVYNYDGSSSEFFHGRPDYFVWDYGSSESWRSGSDACPDNEIVPLTADRETLVDAIEDLVDGGGTGGQVGIAWGWYTLSPNWTSLWPADSDPEAYTNDDVLKFALIMTDGAFNAEYGMEEYTTCGRRSCTTDDYWVERYQRYPSISDPSPTRAMALCDAMKAEDIEIYAVYFDTGGSGFGDALMEDCATDDDNYYEADSREELIAAFSNIAKKIQSIYLSK